MKRMIRYAAENNYDAITLNTGEQVQKIVGGELTGQKAFYDEKLPGWMKKYAKQHGVKVEPSQYFDEAYVTKRQGMADVATKEYERLLAEKAAANEARDYAAVDALRPRLDELQRFIQSTLGEALDTPHPVGVTKMPLNASMKEQAITRGFPLLQVGAPLGGSALLAALYNQQNS